MVLAKPQWRSWLVRGGFIITAYGGHAGTAHVGLGLAGRADLTPMLGWVGGPLAAMTAVYTAYLFAQARARDLWQSPLLPAHLLVQAVVAGAAVMLFVPGVFRRDGDRAGGSASWPMLGAARGRGDGRGIRPPTRHSPRVTCCSARTATSTGSGPPLTVLALVVATIAPAIAGFAALLGLLLYEHAFVQAGQSVPLA